MSSVPPVLKDFTDALLIQRRVPGRDPQAFRELVNRYAGIVFSASRRIVGNTPDPEDVNPEVRYELHDSVIASVASGPRREASIVVDLWRILYGAGLCAFTAQR